MSEPETDERVLADIDFLELLGKAAERQCGKQPDWPGFKVIAHARSLLRERDSLKADVAAFRSGFQELAERTATAERQRDSQEWLASQERARAEAAERERDKLQAFKDWVHTYLDNHGVPHHPPGSHGAAGCRIGDRMDWLMASRDELRAALRMLLASCPDYLIRCKAYEAARRLLEKQG